MNVGDIVSKKVRGRLVTGKISEIDRHIYHVSQEYLNNPWVSITWDDPMEGRVTSVLSLHILCGITFES